jgi:hypothetical protein
MPWLKTCTPLGSASVTLLAASTAKAISVAVMGAVAVRSTSSAFLYHVPRALEPWVGCPPLDGNPGEVVTGVQHLNDSLYMLHLLA